MRATSSKPSDLLRFEGPRLEPLLWDIRARLGPDATIVRAEKIRQGGVLGFFAREQFRLTARARTAPAPEPAAGGAADVPGPVSRAGTGSHRDHRRGAVPASTGQDGTDPFAALAEAVEDPVDLATAPAAPAFDAVLAQVAASLGERAVSGGTPPAGTSDRRVADETLLADDPLEAEIRSFLEHCAQPVRPAGSAPATSAGPGPGHVADGRADGGPVPARDVAAALTEAGLPADLVAAVLDGTRCGRRLAHALLEAMASLPVPPEPPRHEGSLLAVVGELPTARDVARRLVAAADGVRATLCVASPRPGAGRFPAERRVQGAAEAAERAGGWRRQALAVVAVDCPTGRHGQRWAAEVLASLRPSAVWGAIDGRAKPEDVAAWAAGLGGLDALALCQLGETVSPAAVLHAGIPVAWIDGERATAARWVATLMGIVGRPCG